MKMKYTPMSGVRLSLDVVIQDNIDLKEGLYSQGEEKKEVKWLNQMKAFVAKHPKITQKNEEKR